MNEILQRLFDELKEILHTDEFGYHSIVNGKLVPLYKNNTEEVKLENWKSYHASNPVVIKDNIVLKELVKTKKSISIDNTNNNENYGAEFRHFNIFSIYLIPFIKEDNVVGAVVMPVMGEYYAFKNDTKEQCELIAGQYNKLLIKNGMI